MKTNTMEQATANRASDTHFLRLTELWIWLSALASLAGWSLSVMGQLNRTGYAVFVVVAAGVVFVFRHRLDWSFPNWKKFLRRFRRPLPAAFAVLALLVFLGGVLYPPSNYSGLNYRLARVLQWLAHDQWCWIHTANWRMNDRTCGMEWLSAPLVLFTQSDRALFLLNYVPFLLLPGLVFNVFIQLGVRARVARQWMWLLPVSYNFLLQAGGIANDTFPTVYALAMIAFGGRAWVSRQPADLFYSLLAAALLAGAKTGNLPLLLMWAILIFPLTTCLRQKPMLTAIMLVLAAVVSFLPTAILNWHYLHDWSGLSVERAGIAMKNPVVGVWGNALLLLLNNFTPPLFPPAGWWNQHILSVAPQFLIGPMLANFEQGFHLLPELPTEDWAGFGFGSSLLLLVSFSASFFANPGNGQKVKCFTVLPAKLRRAVLLAPWLALLVYGMKSGMVTPHRLIAPYYPLLLPSMLVGVGPSLLVRKIWWRLLVGIVLLLAAVVLVLSPDRPLWPAKTILSKVLARHPDQRSIARALQVYTTYSARSDALAGVRALLPPEIKVVGFVANDDDSDVSLWRPFGSRRVEHFLLTDPPEQIRQRVSYAVVGGYNLDAQGVALNTWLQHFGAEVVATTNITLKISEGSQPWYVVRLKPQ
jgi:hypothetical protein